MFETRIDMCHVQMCSVQHFAWRSVLHKIEFLAGLRVRLGGYGLCLWRVLTGVKRFKIHFQHLISFGC